MSPAEHFVRHNKRQVDRAISQAYSRLAPNSLARATFTGLLHCVRERSARIMGAPVVNGHHLGVEALFNLSHFADAHVRSLASWDRSDASWRGAVRSLAQHLVGRYRIPGFLGAAWYAADDSYSEAKRTWFVAHAAGASFRSLDLPICMTRRMEHIFLGSHDHVGIEYAMRRAELLGLGAHDDIVDAVLSTRLSSDLTNGEFWRTVWMFQESDRPGAGLPQSTGISEGASTPPDVGGERTPSVDDLISGDRQGPPTVEAFARSRRLRKRRVCRSKSRTERPFLSRKPRAANRPANVDVPLTGSRGGASSTTS